MTKCDAENFRQRSGIPFLAPRITIRGAALIREKYNIPLVLITLGKDGSRLTIGYACEAAPFLQDNTIETTSRRHLLCLHPELCAEHGLEHLTEEICQSF